MTYDFNQIENGLFKFDVSLVFKRLSGELFYNLNMTSNMIKIRITRF